MLHVRTGMDLRGENGLAGICEHVVFSGRMPCLWENDFVVRRTVLRARETRLDYTPSRESPHAYYPAEDVTVQGLHGQVKNAPDRQIETY
jgi:hypothetical protein